MTRFYIIRHGNTVANQENRLAGHYETPLTDLGREQAKMAGNALRDIEADCAYSSDLTRAYETACIATDNKIFIEKRAELREMYCGEWEGVLAEELDQKYPAERAIWHNAFGKCWPTGGESAVQLYNRVSSALKELARLNPDKNVLIFSHGAAIHCMANWADGIKAEDMKKEGIPANASVTVIEVKDGVPTLIKKGDVSHLGSKATALPKNI